MVPTHLREVCLVGVAGVGLGLSELTRLANIHLVHLWCTVLYCTVLYCTVLHCTVLYCTVLYCTVLYCTALYYTVLHSIILYSCTLHADCSVLRGRNLPDHKSQSHGIELLLALGRGDIRLPNSEFR